MLLFLRGKRSNPVFMFALLLMAASPSLAYEQQMRDEARYLAGQIAERGKSKVAVIDFTDLDGAVTHLGRFMAEELSVALATQARSLRVVDRSHVRSLLKEHKLAADGLIDPKTAKELGRIAGVDALIVATVTPFGDSVRLSIKVLDSENAQVLASSSCNIAKTQAIDSMQRRGVASSGSVGSPAGSTSTGGSSAKTVEKKGILFELQGCQRSGETLRCHVVLTNKATDQLIDLRSNSTRIFDAFGSERYASQIRLGSTSNSVYVTRTLVRSIPMSAGATFDGLPLELRRLTLVEFGFWGYTVQFKDVPISQ